MKNTKIINNREDPRYDASLTYEERAAARREYKLKIADVKFNYEMVMRGIVSRGVVKFMKGETCDRCGHHFAHRSKSKESHYASKRCKENKPYSETETGKRQKKGEDRGLKMRKKMNEGSSKTLSILQSNLDMWRSQQFRIDSTNTDFKKINKFIVFWLNNPETVHELIRTSGVTAGNLAYIVKTLKHYKILSKN